MTKPLDPIGQLRFDLALLDGAGRADRFLAEIVATGGTIETGLPAPDALRVRMHGLSARGATLSQVIDNWRRAASRAFGPLPHDTPQRLPADAPRNHAEEIAIARAAEQEGKP